MTDDGRSRLRFFTGLLFVLILITAIATTAACSDGECFPPSGCERGAA